MRGKEAITALHSTAVLGSDRLTLSTQLCFFRPGRSSTLQASSNRQLQRLRVSSFTLSFTTGFISFTRIYLVPSVAFE